MAGRLTLLDEVPGIGAARKRALLHHFGSSRGIKQAGLSDLKFTRLRADRPLLELARETASGLVDDKGPLNDEVERLFADADHRGLA